MPFIKFDVNEVPLEGKNLVEASAGTGKTFSIAVLVLRLILEKNINIEKILLVTFTNNAVAELEERIRLFVNEAHDYAVNGKTVASHISGVVDKAIDMHGREEVKQRLKDTRLFLDQLGVMTIHGFCGQTLNNLAFETGQLFGSQVQTSMDEIHELYLTDFWRRHINTLPKFEFTMLMENGFSLAILKKLLSNYYAGKKFFLFDESTTYNLIHTDTEAEYTRIAEAQNELMLSFENHLRDHSESLRTKMEAHTHAKKCVDNLSSADKMWPYLCAGLKKGTAYFRKLFDEHLIDCIDRYYELQEERDGIYHALFNNLCCFALQEIPSKIANHIERAGVISYNGLIKNLHKSITGVNSPLIVKELASRYDAVFVDEFQDTDKLQYEIFKTAFHNHTILFYIGDPKQSIYAFRQADINTYLASYRDVEKRYSMNTNFRSSPRLLKALNQFFLPGEGFDTFYFPDKESAIKYVNVDANPAFNVDNDLHYGDEKFPPLNIERAKVNEEILDGLSYKILELLTDKKYRIGRGEHSRPVRPSDIAVLVSDHKFGNKVKEKLNDKNIPAVVFNDEKIMESSEASALYHIMRAMLEPVIENINTGLLCIFTGKKSYEVGQLKREQLVELFRNYKGIWETVGVNSAISAFIADFGVNEYLTDPETPNGLRIITNLNQLKELLNKTEYYQQLNPAELLDWMKQARDLELLNEDEGVIRLENDAESVTITTVHRSKGLQFNIVFSPQSDFPVATLTNKYWIDIYEDGKYVLIPVNQLTEENLRNYELQGNQERRRLLYVALTRAVYTCFIYTNSRNSKKSNVKPFIDQVADNELIQIKDFKMDDYAEVTDRYIPEEFRHAIPAIPQNDFRLAEPDWRFMSYSGLATKPEYLSIDSDLNPYSNDYDEFIFESLRKGSITGTMLHEIFEGIHFQQTDSHHYIINKAINRYAASRAEVYSKFIPMLVEHVLNASIPAPDGHFRLNELNNANRLQELEFDFPVTHFFPDDLIEICREAGVEVSVISRGELYGMMNGFIDLLFEYNGKYYILDWKSNFLGNSLDSYHPEMMNAAMTRNNYHLQYLIYTVAVSKYLNHRLPGYNYEEHFGGVMYSFVRGMRKGSDYGIFFTRPDKELIKRIDNLISTREKVESP